VGTGWRRWAGGRARTGTWFRRPTSTPVSQFNLFSSPTPRSRSSPGGRCPRWSSTPGAPPRGARSCPRAAQVRPEPARPTGANDDLVDEVPRAAALPRRRGDVVLLVGEEALVLVGEADEAGAGRVGVLTPWSSTGSNRGADRL